MPVECAILFRVRSYLVFLICIFRRQVTRSATGQILFRVAAVTKLTMSATGALTLVGTPGFSAGDKYLIVDANGNVHVSALGPAS